MILVIDISEETYNAIVKPFRKIGEQCTHKSPITDACISIAHGKLLSEILYTNSWEEHVNNLRGIYNETDKNKH